MGKGISVKGVIGDGLRLSASRRRTVAFFLLAVALIVAFGVVYYRYEQSQIRAGKYRELAAIAELKAGQITQWRRGLLADARRLVNGPLVRKAVGEWLQGPQISSLQADLEEHFKPEQEMGIYAAMLLVDPRGQASLPLLAEPAPLEPEERRTLEEAIAQGKAALSDFYRCSLGHIHLDAIAPVLDPQGQPLAAMVLRANAADVLHPLIRAWPIPSQSAETLLVRVEGEEVLYLNDLRFQPGAALSLRLPLSRVDLPAVQAALGKQGMFEGKDYRGVKVLADLRPIPDSPWFMVTKVDLAEILAEARYRAGVTGLFVLLFILLAALTTITGYRRQQATLYQELYQAERQEREAREEFRITLYSIGDAVITTDAAGLVKQMNLEAERLTGWTEAEARGRPLDEVFHILNEESRAMVESPVQRVLREGMVVGLANHSLLIARDGSERPIADSGAPIRGEGGAIIGVVLVFRDQTEERAAQKALEEGEEKYRTLVENAGEVIFVIQDGRFKYFNAQLSELTGYSREELLAMPSFAPLVHPEDRQMVVERYQRRLAGEPLPERYDFRYLHRDGSVRWAELGAVRIAWEGRPATLNFATDITERKRAEERLSMTAEMLDTAPSAVTIHDYSGRFLYANRKCFELHGYDKAEFMTINLHQLDVPESEALIEQRLRLLDEKGEATFEVGHYRKDGTILPLEVYVKKVVWEGQPAVLSIATDITERKRAEEERQRLEAQLRQAQKMEAVGRLAGGVAHDFNNMLGVILGYASMALSRLNPADPLCGDLQEIVNAAKRSADLTQRLLAFSRRQTIAPKMLDLNAQLKGMERLLRRIIGEDIELELKLAPELWPVCLDPSQVDQVVANLTVNSRDAMSEGGKLTVETCNVTFDRAYLREHPWARPGDYVLLAVSDTGCGMDKETLDHVFEPFFTTKPEGTGLGLSMTYGIVKQHDGFIDIYSEPGRGTTVKIYFPRYQGKEQPQPLAAREAAPARGRETILLVEDEGALRQLARRLLERLGYTVLQAATPEQALEVCAQHEGPIHLLLTDVIMPQMGGKELAERIAAIKPGIKALFMSGYTAEVIGPRGILKEGIHFLQKPFSPEALAQKVREALGG